jgi:hypothetical protein
MKKKNILGTELKSCNKNLQYRISDSSINGYCNEPYGGYHNICINMNPYIANNFSELTGQSNWSKSKQDKNHCICQGAWANYIAKLKKEKKYNELPIGILNCEAIPIEVLNKYKNEFKHWNNVTINNQHIDAYNELIRQCKLK